jgi:RNA polymerase sigma factor (sigma-70 family)
VDPNEVAAALQRAAAGDQTAWDALVDDFSQMLWAVASGYRLGHADTAEVVQTAWLRLVENLDRIKQPEALGGWLATTARREALRLLRLRGREPVVDDDARFDLVARAEPSPEDHALDTDRKQRVWAAFGRLPEHCRTLLYLLSVVAVSYSELATMLDMPVGSIGPTRARCLARLRRLLVSDGVSDLGDV